MRELLADPKLKVRAGKANEFAETAKSYGMLTPAQAKRLTVVPVDLEDEGTIAAAIGNAGRVSWGGSGAVRLNTC